MGMLTQQLQGLHMSSSAGAAAGSSGSSSGSQPLSYAAVSSAAGGAGLHQQQQQMHQQHYQQQQQGHLHPSAGGMMQQQQQPQQQPQFQSFAAAVSGGGPVHSSASNVGQQQQPQQYVGDDHALRGATSAGGSSASSGSISSSSSSSLGGPDGYGILGLLSVIKLAGDRDLSVLALGTDLTSLGMALGSPEPLAGSFAHPYGDSPTAREPVYTLPPCYKMPQPALKTGHLARFEPGTLLYIFHAMPRDLLQAYAAQELYGRGWRYHRELKAWFRKADPPAGTPQQAAQQLQQWVYWEVSSWSAVPYTGNAGALVAGFLTEEEVKVRPPGQQQQAAAAAPAAPAGGQQ